MCSSQRDTAPSSHFPSSIPEASKKRGSSADRPATRTCDAHRRCPRKGESQRHGRGSEELQDFLPSFRACLFGIGVKQVKETGKLQNKMLKGTRKALLECCNAFSVEQKQKTTIPPQTKELLVFQKRREFSSQRSQHMDLTTPSKSISRKLHSFPRSNHLFLVRGCGCGSEF